MNAVLPISLDNLISVDWGSTHVRAEWWLQGELRERCGGAWGVLEARTRGFLPCLEELCGAWLSARPGATLVLSGMVGSREGLQEVPYVNAPARAEAIAAAMVEIQIPGAGRAFIVPGLRVKNGQHVDLMRGEETQVLGALPDHPGQGLYCLPGTHSKWVRTEGAWIVGFRTFVTGEAFGMLSRHGLLATLMTGEDRFDTAGFDAGLARSGEPLGLLHHLFTARADVLGAGMSQDVLPAFLSGLLIGHELRAVPAWIGEGGWPPPRLHLVGSPELTAQYARALSHFGTPPELLDIPCQGLGAQHLARLLKEAGR